MPATVSLNFFGLSGSDWDKLGDPNAWQDYINYIPEPAVDEDTTPLSVRVLNKFGVPIDVESTALLQKGTLPGYDIKNMDAFNVIRVSLLEEMASVPPRFVEVYCNPEGEAQFIDVGATTFAGTARYRVFNRNVVNLIEQVKVVGWDPPAMVYVRGPLDLLDQINQCNVDAPPYEYVDDIAQVATDTCYEKVFERYATIMYPAPVLRSDWKDTVESLYEIEAFEDIIGWIHAINFSGIPDETWDDGKIDVVFSDTTPYPVEITIGDLYPIGTGEGFTGVTYYYTEEEVNTSEEVRCYVPPNVDFNQAGFDLTIKIPRHLYYNEDTGQCDSDLLDVRQVFIMGYEAWDMVTITEGNSTTKEIFCKNRNYEPYNLNQSSDYLWGFDTETGNLKIVFGYFLTQWMYEDQTFSSDPWKVGWVYNGPYAPGAGGSGDGFAYWGNLGGSVTGPNFIFNKMYVIVTRKKNSVTIYDPDGRADYLLGGKIDSHGNFNPENFSYNLYAMVKCDPPAPVAGRGLYYNDTIDFTDCMFDHNPMTFQDLTTCGESALENAMEAGPSFEMTLPFIDDVIIDITDGIGNTTVTYPPKEESKLYAMADFIYNLLNETVDEVTYVLGPDEVPNLGDSYQGATINEISYSYQDSSSYLISVKVGPKFLKEQGMSQSALYQMDTETVTKEGVITQSAGNGIHYVVHVENMGDFIAINCLTGRVPPEIGDRVTIQIDNIPVGWK